MSLPGVFAFPHFICEGCQVRALLNRELILTSKDFTLLLLERMRLVDIMGQWSLGTLRKYGPKLRYLRKFEAWFDVALLRTTPMAHPPRSPAIGLVWAELWYSLRSAKGKDGDFHRISFGTVRSLRSAASCFYTLDFQAAYAGRLLRDKQRRTMVMDRVLPTDEPVMSFAASAMARRLGTDPQKSWALSHVHVAFIDQELDRRFVHPATSESTKQELACAGLANLLAYLGWLRGGELFTAAEDALHILTPDDGPALGLPPGIGALTLTLLPATKSDPSRTADVVVAFRTLSGLCPGKWALRHHRLRRQSPWLFSSKACDHWTGSYFRIRFALPILELQRAQGEPTLQVFQDVPGQRVSDKVYSLHSWRRGGRSRVSRRPRHNEPQPPGGRRATADEVYEHGRWAQTGAAEDMPRRYNQWDLVDRIGITLFCM